MTVDEQRELSPEEEKIVAWRLEQILRLGLSEVEATLLAESPADLGLLRRLTGQGCPPSLALQIAL